MPTRETAAPRANVTSDDATRAEVGSGLDALETELVATEQRRGWRRAVGVVLPGIVGVGLLVLVWQSLVWLHVKPTYVLPAPAEVWSSLSDAWTRGDLADALLTSVRRAVLGFALVVALSVVLGLLISTARPVRSAVRPLLSGLQTLPSIAWVLVVVLWTGLTETTIYVVLVLAAAPAVTNGLVSGLDAVAPIHRRAGRVLGAGPLQLARHVLLPAALPAFAGGLRQGWAFGWHALMTAEVIAFGPALGIGVGHLLDNARQQSDMPGVFAAILVILAVGVLAEQAFFAPLERALLRRRGITAR